MKKVRNLLLAHNIRPYSIEDNVLVFVSNRKVYKITKTNTAYIIDCSDYVEYLERDIDVLGAKLQELGVFKSNMKEYSQLFKSGLNGLIMALFFMLAITLEGKQLLWLILPSSLFGILNTIWIVKEVINREV